jgi:hypothetical protein
MKYSDAVRVIKDLVSLPEPIIPFITGPPGVGKTALIKQAFNELKWDLLICHPAVDESVDYKGLPGFDNDSKGKKQAAWFPYGNLRQMIEAKRPLAVFFDDLGQSHRMVMAAIMQLVHGGAINGVPISKHVRFVMASNRAGDKAGADSGVIEPLKDRSCIMGVDVDVDEFIKWGLTDIEDGGGGLPPAQCAFHRFKPDKLHEFAPNRDLVNSASPRGWERVGRCLNAGIKDPEVHIGNVGEGPASELLAFLRTFDKLPKIDKILMDPKESKVPTEPDVRYALCGALAHRAKKDNLESILIYTDRLPAEFGVTCVKDAITRDSKLCDTRAFQKWAVDKQDLVL